MTAKESFLEYANGRFSEADYKDGTMEKCEDIYTAGYKTGAESMGGEEK